ncbi:MAG: hypothetical protein WBC51_24560 [Vicinamibacterales bacterium]
MKRFTMGSEKVQIAAVCATLLLAPAVPAQSLRVIQRFQTTEATQAVAVDATFFYAIGNARIGKYDRRTGQRVAVWAEVRNGPVAHLNSGIVAGAELYCAHSNYPDTPMVSSIEVFDTTRMTHVRSLPLPSGMGSATWVERKNDEWWVTFAHYAGRGGETGKGPEHTRLIRFDNAWRQRGAWAFPAAVVARWDGMSSSGGVWVDDRRLYTTGHHAREIYVLETPTSGSELILREVLPFDSEGQGIAFDRASRLLYSIQRRTREVLASRIP